ncbi:MAG TPA: CPBP family intramembrane glutamic endopeptidase [Mycobacteriales bacterium]|nr:CPBP family intramembrane glutamic endopeptidase [Mycobacteriales bacterium]
MTTPVRGRLPARPVLLAEVGLVMVLTLLQSAVFALLDIVRDLLQTKQLSNLATAPIVGSNYPGHPWLDLLSQLVYYAFAVTPVWLVIHLAHRDGETAGDLGLARADDRLDVLRGAGVAAVVGGAGLGIYLIAHAVNASLTVVPEDLPGVWWRIPVLLISALHSGLVEEIVMIGWLLRRLGQLGWTWPKAVALSAVIRGGYHLYQGFGAFLGNAVMGVIFAFLWRRWNHRVWPLVIAHFLMDAVAYVGYAELHGHVSWLP